MSLPIVFEPEVEAEVDEAYHWYEGQRRGLGEGFLAAVRAALDRIQLNPELHAVVYREVRRALVRRFPYAVYYRTRGTGDIARLRDDNALLACSPFLGPVIMGVICSSVHWTKDRAGLHR